MRHHRPRPLARALAVALAATLALSACTGTDEAADPAPAPAAPGVPAPDVDGTAEEDATPETTEVVAVHLVRSGPTNFFIEPVPVRVPAFGESLSARITAAVEALLALTVSPDDELFTSVPADTTLEMVSIDGPVVTLDLTGGIIGSSGSSSQETTFAQQLAHTARVDASIEAVAVMIDGAPITELWGHLDWSEPIAVDPFILSPVTITTPLAGDEVPVGEVTFRGQATVFEATVLVALTDADGTIVEDGFVTASVGAPSRGTWEWTVTLPGPGEYTVVAGESDPSGGEGRPPFSTSRTVIAVG